MRQFLLILSMMFFAFGLCSPAFADRDLEALRAKAEKGDVNAQFELGWEYWLGGEEVRQDYAEAVKWWRKAAEQGDAKAQYTLGLRYERVLRVPLDYAEAQKLFRSAADQGLAQAQFELGLMYQQGEGMPRNYVSAYMWFSLSAAQGYEQARENLDSFESKLTADERAQAQKMARERRPTP